MANDLFWCRRISLKIGSNERPNSAILIGPQGADFRIDFNIKKTRASSANKSSIQIYNLSKESRDIIDKEYDRVTLEAGYQGDTPVGKQGFWGVIFDGWANKVTHYRNSSGDIITSLECIDGGVDWANARVNYTYATGTLYTDVIKDIVSRMKLVKLGDISTFPSDRRVSEGRTRTFATTAKKALDEICRANDCRWTINNNVVEVVSNSAGLKDSQSIPIISSTTGMIGSPSKTEKGILVRTLLHPRLEPNRFVQVVDDLIGTGRSSRDSVKDPSKNSENEAQSGVYRINSISFRGSNYSNEFYCDLNCQASDGFRVVRPQADYSPHAVRT